MILALDTETTGLDLWKGDLPYAVSLCDEKGRTQLFRWKVNPADRTVVPSKKDLLSIANQLDQADELVFHNAKFDIRCLEVIGIRWQDSWWDKTHDTLLLSHLFDSAESHELKDLALKYLKMSHTDETSAREATVAARRQAAKLNWLLSKDVKADLWIPGQIDATDTTLDDYAVLDAVRTINLYLMYTHELSKNQNGALRPLYERERQVQRHTYNIETRGVNLRRKNLFSIGAELQDAMQRAEKKLLSHVKTHYSFPEFNHRSFKDLSYLFFQRMALRPVKTTKKGNPSLDRSALEEYYDQLPSDSPEYRAVDLLFDVRFNEKSLDYITQYKTQSEIQGRKRILHPSFNQVGTRTTRFSCKDPNTQNIGKGEEKEDRVSLRKVFGPRPGYIWLDIDYSQLELRLFAWAAQEASLIEAFVAGQDIHDYVAKSLSVDRRTAKSVVFGLVYGAQQPKIDSVGGPGTYSKFMKLFPSLPRFQAKCAADIQKQGYVETLFGYRLAVQIDSKGKWRRQGPNYVIQGTAGDVFKEGLVNVCDLLKSTKWRKYDMHPVLMVHDELVLEIPRSLGQYTPLLQSLVDAMEEPGRRIDCLTPVEVNRVSWSWDKPAPVHERKLCSSTRTALNTWWKHSGLARVTRLRSKQTALSSVSS